MINEKKFKEYYSSECLGKTECTVTISDFIDKSKSNSNYMNMKNKQDIEYCFRDINDFFV